MVGDNENKLESKLSCRGRWCKPWIRDIISCILLDFWTFLVLLIIEMLCLYLVDFFWFGNDSWIWLCWLKTLSVCLLCYLHDLLLFRYHDEFFTGYDEKGFFLIMCSDLQWRIVPPPIEEKVTVAYNLSNVCLFVYNGKFWKGVKCWVAFFLKSSSSFFPKIVNDGYKPKRVWASEAIIFVLFLNLVMIILVSQQLLQKEQFILILLRPIDSTPCY